MTDKKTCTNCGAELEEKATFCPKCGIKIESLSSNSEPIEGEILNSETIETKFCNNCGAKIDINAEICPKCGVRVAKSSSSEKSAGLALVLSFLFSGLGQIYNGQISKGIVMLVVYLICAFTTFLIIPGLILLVLWIYGMIDAYNTAKKINDGEIVI